MLGAGPHWLLCLVEAPFLGEAGEGLAGSLGPPEVLLLAFASSGASQLPLLDPPCQVGWDSPFTGWDAACIPSVRLLQLCFPPAPVRLSFPVGSLGCSALKDS